MLESAACEVYAALPDGWAAGWSTEHGQLYYFNAALNVTQWHAPSSSTAATHVGSPPDVEDLGIKALKELITSAGLSSADCLDKADLRARAREALAIMPPACTDGAGPASTDGANVCAETAIASALGYVDPIVHAVATRILNEQSSRADAIAQLQRHLSSADAVACADALFGGGARCSSSSSDEQDEDESAGEGTRAEGADLDRVAPWEAAPAEGPATADLLQQATAHADLHAEVLAFAEWVRPRKCELRARSAIKRQVVRQLEPLSNGFISVEAYGSSQTGMGLFCSDVDLHFAPAAPLKQVAPLLGSP